MTRVAKRIIRHLLERTFYVHSPIVQALIVYAFFVVLLRLSDAPNFRLAIWAFTIFSIVSPTINLISPNWKLNTTLFILSWVLLYLAMNITFSAKYPVAPGVTSFSLPMLADGVFLPITAVLRLLWFRNIGKPGTPDHDAK